MPTTFTMKVRMSEKEKKQKKKKEKERERHRSRAAEIQIGPWIDGAAVPDPRIAGRKMHGGAEKG